MNTYRLKITERDFEELRQLVFRDMPREAGAFALAGIAKSGDTTDILVRRHIVVPGEDFLVQNEAHLEISSRAINGLVALCQANGLGAILCHSHPDDSPYSTSDDHGESRVFRALRQFLPPEIPTASLLFYPGGIRGRVWSPNSDSPSPISEIAVIGRRLKRVQNNGADPVDLADAETFDRQVLAFGREGQVLIRATKVGIVGVGGTGSSVAEQLARLGVMDLVIIDPDHLERSNKTRVYGTFDSTFERPWWLPWKRTSSKVQTIKEHLKAIAPEASILAIPKSIVLEEAARALLTRDVIFLCTDEHWGRSIVNQIAYQYLIPTINVGVRIGTKDNVISAAVGNIDVLRPDLPCLWCKQSIRAEQIRAESIPQSDREQLAREGYVEGLDTKEPAVISLTTTVSSMAVTQFLQIVTDFMGASGSVSRLNYDAMSDMVTRGTSTIPDRCICKKVRGFGDLKTLNTLSDAATIAKLNKRY